MDYVEWLRNRDFGGPHDLTSLSPSSWAARGWKTDEECDSGTAFEDVDLTEGEWADYDEENDLSVMIENVESSFETIKE